MSRADLCFPDGFAETNLPVSPADQLAKQGAFLVPPTSYPINATAAVSDFGYAARPCPFCTSSSETSEPPFGHGIFYRLST